MNKQARRSKVHSVSKAMRAFAEVALCFVLAAAFLVGLSVDTKGSPLAWYYGGGGGPTIFVEVGDSIQDAIDSADDGWTLQLAYGTHYGQDISLRGRAITLRGAVNGYGAPISTINALGYGRVFECTNGEGAGTVFKNLVIAYGSVFTAYGENFGGGGVYLVASSPTLENCAFHDNKANVGGGLACRDGSSPVVSACTFNDNWAEYGGGVACENMSNPLIDACILMGNQAVWSGGGIAILDSSSLTLSNSILCSNTPDQLAGRFTDAGGNCIANDCYLDCNDNGIPDECDIADGRSSDCNGNGIPDECGTSAFDSGVQWAPTNGGSTTLELQNVGWALPNEDVRLEVVARANLYYSWQYYTITIGDFSTQWRNHRQCTPNNRNDYAIHIPAEEWNAAISGSTITVELTASEDVWDDCQNTIQITGSLASVEGDSDGDGIADCIDPCPGIPFDCDDDLTELEIIPGMSIARAMGLVSKGGVVNLAAGTYPITETIDPQGKALTLRGAVDAEGNPTTVLDGLGERSVLGCSNGEGPDTVFENLVITHGYNSIGGGMYAYSSSPTLMNCWFVENESSYDGGGLFASNSSATLLGCEFHQNISFNRGGGIYFETDGWGSPVYAFPRLEECLFQSNFAWSGGGGLYIQGPWDKDGSALDVLLTDCVFEGNVAGTYGGAVEVRDGALRSWRCAFQANVAHDDGGGIHASDESIVELHASMLEENAAFLGGGLSFGVGTIGSIQNTAVQGNIGVFGGGIFVYPSAVVELSESEVCGNAPNQIQGVYDDLGGNCVSIECTDTDGDGTLDCHDECPDDPLKTEPGVCGCGVPDDDADGDGVPDCFDLCPGNDDSADMDGDGLPDGCDPCPTWPGDCSDDSLTLFASPADSIAEAILAVPDGGTIQLEVGTYLLPGALNPNGRAFTLTGAVDGDGTLLSVLDAQDLGRVIECSSGEGADTIFENLIITGGSAQTGGGVYCSASSPSFIGCAVLDNVATSIGGGIYTTGESMPTLSACRIDGNVAGDAGGGVFSSFSSLPVISSTFVCGNVPDQISGPFDDGGANCRIEDCESCGCPGDFNGDGEVNGGDLGVLLANWAAAGSDLNNDGITNGGDLGLLLSLWGPCLP